MNTARSIMEKLNDMAEQPGIVDANTWLNGAMKLRVLLQNEQEKLVDMEREVQELKASYLLNGDPANAAKIKTETSDLYAATKKQEVFIKTALDTILLAKKYATVETELHNGQ